MFTFETSKDVQLIKRIITEPSIYRGSRDDFSPEPDQFKPPSGMLYVLAYQDGVHIGLWALAPHSRILWEVHTCILPEFWGDVAASASISFLEWVWIHTPCQRLFTSVPGTNKLAKRFAERAGMQIYGVNPKAYQKDGNLIDLIMLGISRPEVLRCQSSQP